ncbi:hypothetical protein DSO57_1020764 [Entomophthora muscae]|uniref:Uncharacterized protein n=2 Tax=Entomophthora muscae TaxID=34485 RepID=A0ACC2RUT1_9FUNG|nr:hypothetical protein DSO57_1020764 [Entomophthora muscae]
MGNPSSGGSSDTSLPANLRIFSPKLRVGTDKHSDSTPELSESYLKSVLSPKASSVFSDSQQDDDKHASEPLSKIRPPRIPLKKKLEEYLRRQTSSGTSPSSTPETSPSKLPKEDSKKESPTSPLKREIISPGSNVPFIPIGSPVITLKERRTGILRYLGKIHLKEGIWAGVELDEKGLGKNDGSYGGERYFTCPPNTGIFIDPRALRVRKTASQVSPQSMAGEPSPVVGAIQPSKIPIPKRSILRKPANKPSTSSLKDANLSRKPSMASIKSFNSKGGSEMRKKPTPPKKEPPVLTSNLKRSSFVKPGGSNLTSPESQTRFESEDLDAKTLSYLASENANPSIVIRNLLSQLHSSKKQNELLQIRINKKRAQHEATRMIRTELLDRVRKDPSLPPRAQGEGTVLEDVAQLAKKDKMIEECNKKLSQKDSEIQELKLKILEGRRGPFQSSHSDAIFEPSPEGSEVHTILNEFRNLQQQLLIQEEIISLIKEDVYSEANKLDLPARVKQALSELLTLKEHSSRDIVELEEQISTYTLSPSSTTFGNRRDSYRSPKAKQNHLEQAEGLCQDFSQLRTSLDLSEEKRASTDYRMAEPESSEVPNSILTSRLEHSLKEIKSLQEEKLELQRSLESLGRSRGEDQQGMVPLDEYESLKEEKDQYLLTVDELQRERDELVEQVNQLRDSVLYSESPQGNEEKVPQRELEERIRALEDELVTAKAFAEKVQTGTLTQEDIHHNIAQELEMRNQAILQLETKVSDAEEKVMRFSDANSQLQTEIQSLENDNWELNDLVKELQDELNLVTEQAESFKAKLTQLEQVLDSLASSSDSAMKLHELVLQLEENETNYRADTSMLYKVIDEQDEELAQMADRGAEMQERIAQLEHQLGSKAKEYRNLSEQSAQKLTYGTHRFCHLCFEVGHEADACLNPKSPTELDEATLAHLEEAAAELDSELNFASQF